MSDHRKTGDLPPLEPSRSSRMGLPDVVIALCALVAAAIVYLQASGNR